MRKTVKSGLTHFCYTIHMGFLRFYAKKLCRSRNWIYAETPHAVEDILAQVAEKFKHFFAHIPLPPRMKCARMKKTKRRRSA